MTRFNYQCVQNMFNPFSARFYGLFFGIGRKTYSLLATRSFLVIKVFRLQRKTLLLFLGFFSTFIKVFRLQRKTFLLFLGFFFTFIIIVFFSYRFCAREFSETARWIFIKLSGLMEHEKTRHMFFFYFDDVTYGSEIFSF